MTTRYLGVDLAWSERSGSGVCVLDETGTIFDEDQLPPSKLPAWVRYWRGDRSVLALDGPLIVPPGSATLRPVERELHRRYGRSHAGPFPGGAASTSMRGRDRSPAQALVDDVGSYDVDPTGATAAHRAIEVFPAPGWSELFGLLECVVYKRGRKAKKVAGLSQLRGLLSTLRDADPPLRAPERTRLDVRLATARTGKDWKAVEDIIDARLCAYVAQLWEREAAPEWVVTGEGTWRDGYVVIPSGSRAAGDQRLHLSHPRLDFWVDMRLRRLEGRWLATADLGEDRPDVGSAGSRVEAIHAALQSLGEPYASDMAGSASLEG